MDELKIKEEVWQKIQSMNRSWTIDGKPDELKNYFHYNMVVLNPSENKRIEGREACVAAWKNFCEEVKINSWEEIDPLVQLYCEGKCAVVTYYWDMSYNTGGKTIKIGGRDMLTLVNENGRWWIVADQFSPYPQEN
jgi:hypothetical protein